MEESPQHDKISSSIVNLLLRCLETFLDPSKLDKEKLKAFAFEDRVDIFQDSLTVEALYPLLGVLLRVAFGFQFKRWQKQLLRFRRLRL